MFASRLINILPRRRKAAAPLAAAVAAVGLFSAPAGAGPLPSLDELKSMLPGRVAGWLDDDQENQLDKLLELVKEGPAAKSDEEDDDAEPAEDATDKEQPADAKPDEKKFKSAAERIREMRQSQAEEKAKPLIAQIDFASPLMEQPVGVSLFGGGGLGLRDVLSRLEQAKNDDECQGVLLTFYYGGMMNTAQAQEVREKIFELREAGKPVFVYADSYDTGSYLVASAASDIVLMEGGEVFVPGVAVEPMFYNEALTKFGVEPNYIQIGEYKGAEEPYTRSEPSPELAQEMESLVDNMFAQIVSEIAEGRDMPEKKVTRMINAAMLPAEQAKKQGFVDHLADADGLRDLMAEVVGGDEVRLDAAYGTADQVELDPENPLPALMSMFSPPEVDATSPSVAVVYAEGVISGGEGEGGLFSSGGVGSETIRRAMRMALRDDEVKAVVIRIDSPGGSALASEAMYQAVRRVAEEKPVIISIGGMAASGGYYLAVAGDHIYADPAGIVGSIGVVGGKLVMDDLYDMIGLNTASFSRGKNANLFSETQEWDERQRDIVRRWMTQTYEQFTSRVMSTRDGKIQDIDKVARGRIFLAEQAIDLGMVDELGGIEDAIAKAAQEGGLDGEYDVITLPGPSMANPLEGLGLPLGQAEAAKLQAILSAMPPRLRQTLAFFEQTANLLADRPVIVLTPFTVRID